MGSRLCILARGRGERGSCEKWTLNRCGCITHNPKAHRGEGPATMSVSNFMVPAMKRLMKPTQKLKPGLLPKNIIPKNKWTVRERGHLH